MLDKKLNCIEATASEVLAVYQSATPITVALAEHKAEPCEAYICVVNKHDHPNIYVALATKSKKVFVYKPSSKPDDADSAQTILEAMDFVKGMGFSMESVDLNYSAAMKTVVVGNIKVLRSPGTAARAVMKKRTTDALPKGDKLDKSLPPVAVVEERAPTAVLPVVAGKAASGRDEELAAIRAELKRVSGEKNNAVSRLDTQKGKLKQLDEEKKTVARQLGDELAAVRTELARVIAEKAQEEAAGENALAALSGEVAELAAARDAALLREQELAALQRTTAEELTKTRAELERVALEVSMAAEVATAQTEKSRLADAELAGLRIEKVRLVAELAAATNREQELTTAKESLAEELAAMRVEVAELAMAAAAAQEKDLPAVRDVLAAEFTKEPGKFAEPALAGELAVPQTDGIFVERNALPASGLPVEGEVANALEGSVAKRRTDNTEKATVTDMAPCRLQQATQRWTAEDYCSPPKNVALPATGFVGADVPDSFPLLGEDQAFFNAAADEDNFPAASFVLGTGLSAIEYGAAEDILELYNSVNVVRISPEGGKLQNSKAYICSVGKSGAVKVFIGLYLVESCRTLVYLQDQPPLDEAAYGSAINKAMEFVEAVGFMMGPVALADPAQRGDFLGRLPVLKLVTKA
jgi:hypothetical protein